MHRTPVALTILAAAASLVACRSNPQPATPAPEAAAAASAVAPAANAPAAQPAPQQTLAGDWEVRISSAQQGAIATEARFVARGGGYVGVLQPLLNGQGNPAIQGASGSPIQVRSASIDGNRATIVIDLDGEEGRIVATFRGPNMLDGTISSRYLSGRVTLQRR